MWWPGDNVDVVCIVILTAISSFLQSMHGFPKQVITHKPIFEGVAFIHVMYCMFLMCKHRC